MTELLKEYSDYIIGIPSFITATLLTIYIFLKQKQKKSLACSIDSYYDIISNDIKNTGLQVFYNHIEYKEVCMLIFGISNDGDIPIEKINFEKPIDLVFNENSIILDYRIEQKQPESIIIIPTVKDNILSIEPFLLNSKEEFKLKILISNNKSFNLDYRISGISKINKTEIRQPNTLYYFTTYGIIFLPPCWIAIYLYKKFLIPLFGHSLILFSIYYIPIVFIILFLSEKYSDKFKWIFDRFGKLFNIKN